jgi:hypothetical protein
MVNNTLHLKKEPLNIHSPDGLNILKPVYEIDIPIIQHLIGKSYITHTKENLNTLQYLAGIHNITIGIDDNDAR